MLELVKKAIDPDRIKFSLCVKDLKTGKFYNHNEHQIVSSASTIKLMIMAEVFNQVKQGMLSLDRKITVREEDKVPFSILTMLETGNAYTLRDIITLMIVQSDNTATNLLIDMAGVENINAFISSFGLNNTILQRKMMDFSARKQGMDNFTTAADMAYFLELLYKGEIVDEKYSAMMIEIMKMQLDRSMIYSEIPDDIIVAHKSGELDNIDHEVGIFYIPGREYIFAMLTYEAVDNNYARRTVGKAAKIVYEHLK